MSKRLVVLPLARQDLLDEAAFIARDNPEAGDRLYEAAEATFRQLASMPEMGAPRTYGRADLTRLRMFPVRDFPTYLVFYRTTALGIEIVRVLHGARDISAILDEEG
jgi:toxin ParE1/3/4